MSWSWWDTITKPSFPLQSAKIIVHFQSDEDVVMKALWANVATSGAAFFFFPPQWPEYPPTLDTCWTFNGPHTHTHTDTIVILTLTCSETSHPLSGMTTLRNHPALAPTPRAQVRERTGHYLTVRQGHLRWLGRAFIDIRFPSMDRGHSHTLESTSCRVFTVGLSFHTEIWKIIHNFTRQQAWFHLKINDFWMTPAFWLLLKIQYRLLHCLHSGSISIYL